MNPSNINSRIRTVIYRMKREWGAEVAVFTRGSTSADPDTGERSIALTRTTLSHVIVPPAKMARQVIEGIFNMRDNPRLAKSGGLDDRTRAFIIDRRDAPDLQIARDDFLGFQGTKYDIQDIEEFPIDSLYLIEAKGLIGEPVPGVVHNVTASIVAGVSLDAES